MAASFFNSLLLQLVVLCASATIVGAQVKQRPDAPRLAEAEKRVRNHIERVYEKLPAAEKRSRTIVEQARRDGVGKRYTLGDKSVLGPREHPWLEANPSTGANPNAVGDYLKDSFVTANNSAFLRQTWSCFEPQLLAKGFWGQGPDIYNPASADLAFACKMSCPPLPPPLPDNGYEVIQFWWPEHHIAVNNYARSRFDPQLAGPHGAQYTRKALLSVKQNLPEEKMKQALAENYPLPIDKFKEPSREDPFIGQSMWGGESSDTTDRQHAHIYRSLLSVALGDRKPTGVSFFTGWLYNPRSIYLSLAPSRREKPIANLWTEYGMFEAITAVPQFSYLLGARGQRAMNALYGSKEAVSIKVRREPEFFKTTGSASFRVARWFSDYGGLQEVAEIEPNASAALREVVYHGGQELFPLTLSLETFATPNTSAYAVMARRAAHLAGARETAALLPGGERSRMIEFTVSGIDPGREIDKLQRIAPGGAPSECYRSQRIPNMVEQTEDAWVSSNFPHDLMGYVQQDFGDMAFTYWNKRVACTCRVFGTLGGSWAMNFPLDSFGTGRGTGDRPYGKIEAPLCSYIEKKLPSGFSGTDQPPCPTGNTRYYKGLDDHV